MSDVNKKAIDSNDLHSGWVVTGVQKGGQYQSLPPNIIADVPSTGQMYERLNDRFDDITYYTIGSG